MTEIQSLLSLAGIFLLACCSPGPVFLLIATVSAKQGRTEGLRVSFGVATATLFWATGTMLGLGVLLTSIVWMQGLIKLVAGLYLLWLGTRMLADSLKARLHTKDVLPFKKSPYRSGLIASITNPKALAFFGSVFALTTPENPTVQYEILAVFMLTALSVVWHGAMALIFATPQMQRGYQKLKNKIDLYVGIVFAGAGSWIIVGAIRRAD